MISLRLEWLALAAAFCCTPSYGQSTTAVQSCSNCGVSVFDKPLDQRAMDVLPLPDGGFLLLGMDAEADPKGDFMVQRLSPDLAPIWRKVWGETGTDFPFAIVRAHDKNFVIAGISEVPAKGTEACLIKISEKAEVMWTTRFGSAGDDRAAALCAASDGTYVVAGQTTDAEGRVKGLLAKLDERGTIVWSVMVGMSSLDRLFGVVELSNGDVLASGLTNANYPDNSDILLVRITPDGKILWQKSIGSPKGDIAHAMLRMKNNTIMLVGYTAELAGESSDPLIMQMDSEGKVLSKTILQTGLEGRIMNAEWRNDERYLYAAGYIRATPRDEWDAMLIKYDVQSGRAEVLRQEVAGGTGELFGIRAGVAVGHSQDSTKQSDILLIRRKK